MFGPKFASLTFYGPDVTIYTAGFKLKNKKYIFHTRYIDMLLTILGIISDISPGAD